jgi:hypothetical protein
MHNHLEEGDCGNTHVLEVVRVVLPWLFVPDYFLFPLVITIQSIAVGIYELDTVLQLYYP